VPWGHQALIFGTGAVALSLELLASRILTPYFGVSLYIWAGILSITLVFLALGYHAGGRLAQRGARETLGLLFLSAPVAAAAAIGVAGLLYPLVLPALAGGELATGSFVGATLLLAIPLVTLSAMNPLLIGLAREAAPGGDGGAGRVFFVSTMGSVAGVLFTAFVFIPNVTNHRAVLAVGLALAAGSVVAMWRAPGLPARHRRRLLAAGLLAALGLAALLVAERRYVEVLARAPGYPFVAAVRAEYPSVFGSLKVVDLRVPEGAAAPMRLLVQDGLIQNRTTLDGVSLSPYTYVLEALARAFHPEAREALVLGLGAGIVPRGLRQAGLRVTVVEINAAALRAARDFFGFLPDALEVRLGDARTVVRDCRGAFDLVVIDLFQGDTTPDYLLTAEFFRDVRRCLSARGVAVMNAFFTGGDEEPNRRLLATVASAFPGVFEFRSAGSEVEPAMYNAYVVATAGDRAPGSIALPPGLPDLLAGLVARTLAAGRRVTAADLGGAAPVTDDGNVFGVLQAAAQLRFRAFLAQELPPHVLLN
jgi:predicted membrane-bound spermidine synthase